jgi:hypothetical protein
VVGERRGDERVDRGARPRRRETAGQSAPSEIEPDLFQRLRVRRRDAASRLGIDAPAQERHVARPGIERVLGALDEKGSVSRSDAQHGGDRGVLGGRTNDARRDDPERRESR